MIESRSKEQLKMKSSNSHNADQTARKAEMMQRAQMVIDGRQGAVGCGHSGDAVKRARRAVSAQKSGRVAGVDAALYYAEVFGRRGAHFEKCLHRSAHTLRSVF